MNYVVRPLTPTESNVLRCLALHGGTNAEIGRRLGMATKTVGTHLSKIMLKLGQHRRAALVAWAWRTGFVDGDAGRRGAA